MPSPGVKKTIGVPAEQIEAACVTPGATVMPRVAPGAIGMLPGVAPDGTVAETVESPNSTNAMLDASAVVDRELMLP
jgi:hypothetical protein